MDIIVVGATGLTATSFVKQAISSDRVKSVNAFSRSSLSTTVPASSKLKSIVQPADEWGASFPRSADVMFSGVGTTRSAAGGLDKQRLVDHDLQLKLAEEAKAKGCSTFVLVSSAGANSNSWLPYFKLKGEIEEDIAKVGFDRVIILRPGALLGAREKDHGGYLEGATSRLMPCLHRSWAQGLVGYPIHVDEIATATLKLLGTVPNGVHKFESSELLDISK